LLAGMVLADWLAGRPAFGWLACSPACHWLAALLAGLPLVVLPAVII